MNAEKPKVSKKKQEKIELITVEHSYQILEHDLYVKELSIQLSLHKNKLVLPPAGKRWKRNPFTELDERGFLDSAEKTINEFGLIIAKKSNQSSSVRSAINEVCTRTYYLVKDKFNILNN